MAIFSAAGIGSENLPFTYRGKTGFCQGVILKYLQITILPMKPGLPEAEAEVKAPSLGKELACPFVNPPSKNFFTKKSGSLRKSGKTPLHRTKRKEKHRTSKLKTAEYPPEVVFQFGFVRCLVDFDPFRPAPLARLKVDQYSVMCVV